MIAPLLVFAGGGLGALLRYLVTLVVAGPLSTLLVNVVGSFAIGLLAGLQPEGTNLRLFLVTGLLGGFTTFSAFSIDSLALWQRGAALPAAGYVAASVALSLAAAAAAYSLVRPA